MKKVIHRKDGSWGKYDTDTAKRIQNKSNDYDLYVKKTGEYFLHGHNQIRPLTDEEAKIFCMNYAPQYYMHHFEFASDKKSMISLMLPERDIEKLKRLSNQINVSMGEFVSLMLDKL